MDHVAFRAHRSFWPSGRLFKGRQDGDVRQISDAVSIFLCRYLHIEDLHVMMTSQVC